MPLVTVLVYIWFGFPQVSSVYSILGKASPTQSSVFCCVKLQSLLLQHRRRSPHNLHSVHISQLPRMKTLRIQCSFLMYCTLSGPCETNLPSPKGASGRESAAANWRDLTREPEREATDGDPVRTLDGRSEPSVLAGKSRKKVLSPNLVRNPYFAEPIDNMCYCESIA